MTTQSSRDALINSYHDRIRSNQRTRLPKEDLSLLVEGFVELLQSAKTEKKIQALCQAEIKLLEEGYPQASVAKYLTVYRKAIAAAIEAGVLKLTKTNSHRFIHQQRVTGTQEERLEHWALTYLKYSSEVYEAIDKRSQLTNRDKQLNLRLVPVDRYLRLLRDFLDKKGMYEARWLATAIAGLTGRRFAEVMAKGTFSLTEHPYLLRFEGQLKSRAGHGEGYDIVTLFPAVEVLEAIQRLRRLPEVKAIARLKGKALSEELNRFNQKLNTVCSTALMQVVPSLEGKKSVSVHNLRSLYGAIAVYQFCPPLQHEYVFVQHFLGHVMDSPATGHYFRFALGDDQGNLIRDKGVLLEQVEPLPLGTKILQPEAESESTVIELDLKSVTTEPQTSSKKISQQKVNDAQNELQPLRTEWFSALEQLRADFESQLQSVQKESDAGWFIRRVEGLERENLALRLERDQAKAAHQEYARANDSHSHTEVIERLQAENLELSQKLKQAQDKLDGFRKLLNGNQDSPNVAAQSVPTVNLTEQGEFALEEAIASPPQIEPQATPKTRGPKAGKAFRRAEAIVLAIKDWNHLYPYESFAINAAVLEMVFRIHRQAAKEYLDTYQNELWEYHQDIGVESHRWHNRGKDTERLKQFVEQKLSGVVA